MRGGFTSKLGESLSEDELYSEEHEASLLVLLSLRVRDFERLLPLRLLDDRRLDEPRLREEEDKSFLPLMDAGDLGGRWFGAIAFIDVLFEGPDVFTSFDMFIVNLEEFITATVFKSSIQCVAFPPAFLSNTR